MESLLCIDLLIQYHLELRCWPILWVLDMIYFLQKYIQVQRPTMTIVLPSSIFIFCATWTCLWNIKFRNKLQALTLGQRGSCAPFQHLPHFSLPRLLCLSCLLMNLHSGIFTAIMAHSISSCTSQGTASKDWGQLAALLTSKSPS